MALIENIQALNVLINQLLALTARHHSWAGGFPKPNLTNFKTELAAVPVVAFTVSNGTATKYQLGNATEDIASTSDVDYIRQILKIFANKLRVNNETYSIQQLRNTVLNTAMVFINTDISLDVGIPETITALGDGLFANSKLIGMEGGENITQIGERCFTHTPIENFSYPWEHLTIICARAFAECTNLKTLDLSNTAIQGIYANAFLGCSNLESIILPNTLNTIEAGAFFGIQPNAEIIFQGTREQCAQLSASWAVAIDSENNVIQCDDGAYIVPGQGSGSGAGS